MRAEIEVQGIIQGVGFRPFVYRTATSNRLSGYVRNRGDASVEIVVEGRRERIDQFLQDLEAKKPPLSSIHLISTKFNEKGEGLTGFRVVESSSRRKLAGSAVPPDVGICDECSSELRTKEDPRHNYFFITCTNCGPRYTVIRRLPYDRENTTMDKFQLCEACRNDYRNVKDRRFHAQTVACSNCGPEAYLTDSSGQSLKRKNPIREAGRLLKEGFIVAMKGYGGFHLAASAIRDEPVERLRESKFRAQKPFAVMGRDPDTVRTFAEVSPKEASILSSHAKPIVLLNKRADCCLSKLVAPGLHNVGVMLPYTGLHQMLFDDVEVPAFVMTSANPSNEPIYFEDAVALEKLATSVDYFLFHNRVIAQRCDDSVLRLHNSRVSFIRRSRGYTPAPILLSHETDMCALGVGAKENVTACILWRNKAFLSQFIGDVDNLETYRYLKSTIQHLLRLTNTKIEAVACDLHPQYATGRIAQEFSEAANCRLQRVQHHHAHMLSLMGERGLDEIIGIVCDGYGYGSDGKPWGGEILKCTKGSCERVGHLQEQPMPGGDLATRYPARMAAGILYEVTDVEDWLLDHPKYLPRGREEAQIIINQLHGKRALPATTSCGRVLDAAASILDVCHSRTYQGEPAMKLESTALRGRDVLQTETEIEGSVLDTTYILRRVFEERNRFAAADLAFALQSYLATGLSEVAIQEAEKTGIDGIGFSGGVAYNRHFALRIRECVEESGIQFHVHEAVPAGDGGVSLGQALAAVITR